MRYGGRSHRLLLTLLTIIIPPLVLNYLHLNDIITMTSNKSLAIATRLHLGHATNPPPTSQLVETLSSFAHLASTVKADHAVIAVDAEDKIEGYSLVNEVRKICTNMSLLQNNNGTTTAILHVLPITPWGKFVPALNAIVSWSARQHAQYLLLVSAEVKMTSDAMEALTNKMDVMSTLVVGAVLQGHQHHYNTAEEDNDDGSSSSGGGEDGTEVELTGRTTPWNTLALWNLPKLALTGFLQVSEGLHNDEDGKDGAANAGVEEVCTIATLQKILPANTAQAKLLLIDGVQWGQDFGDDEGRKEWHEKKMMSKVTRAKRQLELMGLGGTVLHC
mmetsp:Transcript_26302/g.41284  ORF Transcript_26302/g.41284 Transcript_26302/m.41284 type:complete len:332 (-) Transcript_26302:57-1052(-)